MLSTSPSPDPAALSADDFRLHVGRRVAQLPPEKGEHGDHLLNPNLQKWVLARAVRHAAVLIPVVERHKILNVVLTKRTEHLASHSGQIAFPGGKVDDTDASVEAAALREADEEIALKPHEAELIGTLPVYHTGSGFRITPVIALIDPAAKLTPNPDEVEYIFEVPLAFLMEPSNHHRGSREFQGSQRHYYEMPYGEHYIWGVTAGIIAMMHDWLFA